MFAETAENRLHKNMHTVNTQSPIHNANKNIVVELSSCVFKADSFQFILKLFLATTCLSVIKQAVGCNCSKYNTRICHFWL